VAQEVAIKAEAQLGAATSPPAPPLPLVAPQVLAHGSRNRPMVALTFDACSTRDVSQYDEPVTRALIAANAPATIFLGGRWAKEEAAHVRELAANPLFELGNHTYTHPHLTAIQSEDRIRLEIERTQAEIHELTGIQPRLFRPPYGEYDQRVVRIASEEGLRTIEYDVASGDPDAHATKERLVEWVLRKARPGSIIVMHINHMRFHTAEALPGIISGLRAKGLELVTVGRLLAESDRVERPVVFRKP
jgi:peptidoglycan/xylan/chitin deacetylase (PgdA/CDA1 family)